MRQYNITIIDEVDNDIDEIKAYYEETVGKESALRFEGAMYEALNSLSIFPNGNPLYDEANNLRRANMKTHNVAIIYLVDDNRLEVVAVRAFHAMNNPKVVRRSIINRLK